LQKATTTVHQAEGTHDSERAVGGRVARTFRRKTSASKMDTSAVNL
jgi:hypothetical protein